MLVNSSELKTFIIRNWQKNIPHEPSASEHYQHIALDHPSLAVKGSKLVALSLLNDLQIDKTEESHVAPAN